jgi:hypothetical protein
MLFIGKRLAMEDQHCIAIHGGVDLLGVRGRQRFAQVDALGLGADTGSERAKLYGHGGFLERGGSVLHCRMKPGD